MFDLMVEKILQTEKGKNTTKEMKSGETNGKMKREARKDQPSSFRKYEGFSFMASSIPIE